MFIPLLVGFFTDLFLGKDLFFRNQSMLGGKFTSRTITL